MKVYPFLDMKRLTAPYSGELAAACRQVIDSGHFLHGPNTAAFESELADFCGTSRCVALSNGLDALRLSLRAWVINGLLKPGDGVLVAANTYIASILAITDAGLTPVLVDPQPDTMNIGADSLRRAMSPDVKALMEVHLYGTPVRHSELAPLVKDYGLLVIEDNAQAIGASEANLRTGAMGHVAAFSFYPTKNIGALGDAGAITTDSPELADTVRALANYGSYSRYHNVHQGFNCRMDEMQAAMLRVKLRHIDSISARRRRIADIYDSLIVNPAVTKPAIIPSMRQVWHQYVLRTPRRQDLIDHLHRYGVQTDIHYPTPPHMQPCYAGIHHPPLPLTERLAREVLSIPIATVSESEAADIAEIINLF